MTAKDAIWRTEPMAAGARLDRLSARTDEAEILGLWLAPTGTVAAVHRVVRNANESSSLAFFDPATWSLKWELILSSSPNQTGVGHIELLFVTEERYVVTRRELAMYERDHLRWKASIPAPPETLPQHWSWMGDLTPWKIVGSDGLRCDGERLFWLVHWARILGRSMGDGELEWEDRSAVEVISAHDGTWLERKAVEYAKPLPSGIIPEPVQTRRLGERGFEFHRDDQLVGVLEAPPGRTISSADLSFDGTVAVVLLDGHELVAYRLS